MSQFADFLVKTTKAVVRYEGNRTYYERPFPLSKYPNHISGDIIYMLPKERFADQNEYYFTLFHELAHWAEIRLQWNGTEEESEQIANEVAYYFCNLTNIPVNGSMECSEQAKKVCTFLSSFLVKYLKVSKWLIPIECG